MQQQMIWVCRRRLALGWVGRFRHFWVRLGEGFGGAGRLHHRIEKSSPLIYLVLLM
jgi:hypothetical protein